MCVSSVSQSGRLRSLFYLAFRNFCIFPHRNAHRQSYTPFGNLHTVAEEAHKKLRDLLINSRKHAELTQAELATRLKRPQSFVSKYERGERRLDVVEFGEVARALGINPVRILGKFYREIS
jgi:ribosome-binding protein aMBF1 (putative translation factor)